MLSGPLRRRRGTAALEDALGRFPGRATVDERWSTAGSARKRRRRLRTDPDALRGALDRDIAAIDAHAVASSSTPSCTTRGCAGWKAPGAASPGWSTASSRATGSRSRLLNVGWPRNLPRPGTRHRIRPEPFVPQGVRRRIRHAGRRAVRPDDRRPRRAPPPRARPPHRRRECAGRAVRRRRGRVLPDHPRRLADAAGSRQLRRSRQRHRHRHAAAQRRSCALAQPDDAAGHALHRHRAAARCWRGRHGRTTARAPTYSATPNTRRPTASGSG